MEVTHNFSTEVYRIVPKRQLQSKLGGKLIKMFTVESQKSILFGLYKYWVQQADYFTKAEAEEHIQHITGVVKQ